MFDFEILGSMAVICKICGKIFTQQKNLNRHIRNVHQTETKPVSYDSAVHNSKCLEEGCHSSFRTIQELRKHLLDTHDISIEREEISFENYDEFHSWLSRMCSSDNVRYIQNNKRQNPSSNSENIYFYCNRGRQTHKLLPPNAVRQRKPKSQGTCKLSMTCTSTIQVTRCLSTSRCTVLFFKTHYSHTIQLQHVRLLPEDRIAVATKLASGVTPSRVLDSHRDDIETENLKRADLLTREDINNVKKSFNINIDEGVRHESDVISVDLWVSELYNNDGSVLMYKKQGDGEVTIPSEESDYIVNRDFDQSDFILILMNESQQNMLKTFGHNIICVDSTHGLNGYDFELTTLLVVDDFGKGFPVACMFTNRKDTMIFEVFFEHIRTKVGTVRTNAFMSDITSVFYNAWERIMGPATSQLFCSWHIDRAWRSNLTKISDQEKRSTVYKALKVVQTETNESAFFTELTKLQELLDHDIDTQTFGKYFRENYYSIYPKWSYCHRKYTGINTNMRLESLHKTIKYFYLGGLKVKRLDKGIHAVLRYIRDKTIERIIKNVKGKNSHHITNIDKRHTSATRSDFKIQDNSNETWAISGNDNSYIVTKTTIDNWTCCNLKCTICNICIHAFKCTCVDYFIRLTICKHIHFLALKLNQDSNVSLEPARSSVNSITEGTTTGVELNDEILIHLNTLSSSVKCSSDGKQLNTAQLIKEKCLQIAGLNLDSSDSSVTAHCLKQLNNVYSLLQANNDRIADTLKSFHKMSRDDEINREPANKKIEKQLQFRSTMRKRSTRKEELEKPVGTQVLEVREMLHSKQVLNISNNPAIDHNYI